MRFVRACVRAVWLPSGIGSDMKVPTLVPFSCDLWELTLFVLVMGSFIVSLAATPQTSYPSLVDLIGRYGIVLCVILANLL